MKMSIDVMAVFQEAMDVDAARSVPITVSVLLDEAAPADLVAFVRSSFASASPQARVSVNYFSDASAAFDGKSDMAVIAAGVTQEVGLIARRLRDAGIPALVVTLAEPVVISSDGSGEVTYDVPPIPGWQPDDPLSLEPYALTAHVAEQLSSRMGEWVVACFRAKRLAFAQAFEFVRRPLSMESVRSTSMQNAGVGFVAFIPGADLPIMTLNQAKMVLQIAAAYGQPLTMERAKELAAVVGGGFACRAVARQLVGVVPALGWAIKAGIGYAGTSAMGHAAVEYFEHGGSVAGIAAVVAEARDAAVQAAEETTAGRAAKGAAQELGRQAVNAVKSKAKEAARTAPQTFARVAQSAVEAASQAAGSSTRPR